MRLFRAVAGGSSAFAVLHWNVARAVTRGPAAAPMATARHFQRTKACVLAPPGMRGTVYLPGSGLRRLTRVRGSALFNCEPLAVLSHTPHLAPPGITSSCRTSSPTSRSRAAGAAAPPWQATAGSSTGTGSDRVSRVLGVAIQRSQHGPGEGGRAQQGSVASNTSSCACPPDKGKAKFAFNA